MTKAQIKRQLDNLWGKKVRERDKHRCQWCLYLDRSVIGNQPHHIIPKARGKSIRWDLHNGITLCFNCHHKEIIARPSEFRIFLYWWFGSGDTVNGVKIYQDLLAKSREIVKYTLEDLQNIKKQLEAYDVK